MLLMRYRLHSFVSLSSFVGDFCNWCKKSQQQVA